MLRDLATALAVFIIALILAIVPAWWLFVYAPGKAAISVGPWQTSLQTGSSNAGMYVRAYVAISGLFALNPSEAIYFTALRDDSGQPLQARCTYAIAGKPVSGRWWSLTAYADDNFLIPNKANRFSYNMGNLAMGADGAFRVMAASTEQPGNWLPTGTGSGGFNLLFRIYNPAPELLADPGKVALPSIKRVGACA